MIDLTNHRSEQEKLAFYLNCYNFLLLHAVLVKNKQVQQMRSLADWHLFLDHTSYDVGGYIFSFLELEHCVLREHLKQPSINKLFLLPHSYGRTPFGIHSSLSPFVSFGLHLPLK